MKVLAMGLPRTGSASICKALEILEYNSVYHGIKAIDSPKDWVILDRAADATFPCLPSYTGKAFTHEDWEELYGPCEAVTDTASLFGLRLIEAYPKAKVLLVIRDFEPWYKSMEEGVMQNLWGPLANLSVNFIEPILGSIAGAASRKVLLGFFEAHSPDEARRNARMAYDKHHRELQEAVPANQLLVYRMGDGWGPLCEFLEKPVPDQKFPHVNEAAALRDTIKKKITKNTKAALMVILPWIVGVGAVAAGSWMAVIRLF